MVERWLAEYSSADIGVEGVVVKGLSQHYRPGARGWRKYRIRHAREAAVGAVTGTPAEPRSLVLALPVASGTGMRVAGVTLPLTSMQAEEMKAIIEPYTGGDPWWASPRLSISGFGGDPVPACAVDQTVVVGGAGRHRVRAGSVAAPGPATCDTGPTWVCAA